MSGAKEIRKATRHLRKAGIDVTGDGHPHVLDEQGQLVYVLPKTPGSQSSVRKSRIAAEKIIRGEPVRSEAGNHGPNSPGKLTRDPQEQAPPVRPERPMKERFEPESRDVGPLGYTPEELSARMPAPAPKKRRRPFVTPDDPVAYMRWLSARRQPCMVCGNQASPDQLTPVRYDTTESTFAQHCTRYLKMPADQAAVLAERARIPAPGRGFCLFWCGSCLQRTGLLGGVPRESFLAVSDLDDPDAVRTRRPVILGEPEPAAFQHRPPMSRPALPPHRVITPAHQQVAGEALEKLLGGQGAPRPRSKPRRRKR